MARKSRKAQVQSTPVAEVKKETPALSTAIYARLSVENSGKDDDGNSLQNQIDVCRDYLDGCPWLRLTALLCILPHGGREVFPLLPPQSQYLQRPFFLYWDLLSE